MEYSIELKKALSDQRELSSEYIRKFFGEKNIDKDLQKEYSARIELKKKLCVSLFFKELYDWTDDKIIQTISDIYDITQIFLVITNGGNNILVKAWNERAFKDHPNWDYCIPLMSNVEYANIDNNETAVYDLSVCSVRGGWSANIVYSNEGQDYSSGGSCGEFWLSDAKRKDLLKLMIQFGIKSEDYYKEVEDHNNIMKMFMRSNKDIWQLQKFLES